MSDVEKFEQFVRLNAHNLTALALALCRDRQHAEDLVADALVRSYEKWSTLRTGEELRYVRRCIVNGHVSRWRKVGRREVGADRAPTTAIAAPQTFVDIRLDLVAELRLLPVRQQAVLVLRYLQDLPDDEISSILGIRQSAVRSNAHRGLARLRAGRGAPNQGMAVADSSPIGDA